MPLPRFDRLPAESRAAILSVARKHFARDGKDVASFNQIIADAGISKTSAYHYFDGKDDLFSAVAADVAGRMLAALGSWQPVSTVDELWRQLEHGTLTLLRHLREHPDDRAVMSGSLQAGADSDPWIHDLVANGIAIGLIDQLPDQGLVTAATASIFAATDSWALSQPGLPGQVVVNALRTLLARLWHAD